MLLPGQCVWSRAYATDMPGRGPGRGWGFGARGEAVMMGRAGDTAIAAAVQHRRKVVVDVILLLMRNGRILLRSGPTRATGTVRTNPRPASWPTGRRSSRRRSGSPRPRRASPIRAENVSLAHVMHDVSGSGRIAFFLTVSGWPGECASPGRAGSQSANLPTTCSTGPGWRCGTTPRACASPPTRRSARPAPAAARRCSALERLLGRLHADRTPPTPDGRHGQRLTQGRSPDKLAGMAEILNAHGSKNDIFVVRDDAARLRLRR